MTCFISTRATNTSNFCMPGTRCKLER
jgi:hypothetical protein